MAAEIRLAFPTRSPGIERISRRRLKIGAESGFEVILPEVLDLRLPADALQPFHELGLAALVQEISPNLGFLGPELLLAGSLVLEDEAHEDTRVPDQGPAPRLGRRGEEPSHDLGLASGLSQIAVPRDRRGEALDPVVLP